MPRISRTAARTQPGVPRNGHLVASEDIWRCIRHRPAFLDCAVGVVLNLSDRWMLRGIWIIACMAGDARRPQRCFALGPEKPPAADAGKGPDAPAALRQHRHLSEARRHQCSQRVHQLKSSMGQAHRSRLPQQKQLHHGHLLPLWGPRPHAHHPLRSPNAHQKTRHRAFSSQKG